MILEDARNVVMHELVVTNSRLDELFVQTYYLPDDEASNVNENFDTDVQRGILNANRHPHTLDRDDAGEPGDGVPMGSRELRKPRRRTSGRKGPCGDNAQVECYRCHRNSEYQKDHENDKTLELVDYLIADRFQCALESY